MDHASLRRNLCTLRWKSLRLQALDRDGWRCTICGKAGRLEVHHVQPTSEGGDMWEIGNLRTLCRPCHFQRHAGSRKRQRLAMMRPERRAWWERIYDATS